MKVYAEYKDQKQHLKENLPEKITVTDKKEDADYLVVGRFKKDDYHENLKGIVVPFTGLNGIDLKTVKEKDLMLFNTTVHSVYVAEMAMRLTLAIMGHLQIYHPRMQKGDWSNLRDDENRLAWHSLIGRHVGIYGYGRIGRHLHNFLAPFGVTVNVIDRGKDYGDAKRVSYIHELVDASDVVIIAAPLNKATENAFDDTVLSRMKDKFLINVGRGTIINEEALFNRLKDGTIRGFASDVWFNYPKGDEPCPPSTFPLETLDNVLMTPHCGGLSHDSHQKILNAVLDRIIRIYEGDTEGQLVL